MTPVERKIQRTRTGCIQCRMSKKKCDERRPSCANCDKRNRTCLWSDVPWQSLNQYINRHPDTKTHLIDQKIKRSRNGCFHCKKIKKKCDEIHPQCGRCKKKSIDCIWLDSTKEQTKVNLEENNITLLNTKSSFAHAHAHAHADAIEIETLEAKGTDSLELSDLMFYLNHRTTNPPLLNIFFNKIITTLVPGNSLKLISDITFDALKESSVLRKVAASLTTAYLYINDETKRHLIENMHNDAMSVIIGSKKDIYSLKWMLHSLVFSVLMCLYTEIDNSKLLNHIDMALELLLQFDSIFVDPSLNLLIESLIYHFSVSIIISPIERLGKKDIFILCNILRNYFPQNPDHNSNPLLGDSLDIFSVIAKSSYLFKTKLRKGEMCLDLLQSIDILIKSHSRLSEITEYNTFQSTLKYPIKYITLLACKMLLLSMLDDKNGEISKIAHENLCILKNGKPNTEGDIWGPWGIFIFSLQIKDSDDQEFVVDYFRSNWEETRNLGYFKAIDTLELAWKMEYPFEILRNDRILQKICLN